MGFFDFDKYKGQKVAMHCKTKEEAIDFCNVLHKHRKNGLAVELINELLIIAIIVQKPAIASMRELLGVKACLWIKDMKFLNGVIL